MSARQIHPDMQVLIDATAQTNAALGPRVNVTVEQSRRWWTVYTQAMSRPHPAAMQVHDRLIPTPDHDVPVRVYRPAGPDGLRPGLLYLHGGGFMHGDLDSSDSNAWGLAEGTGAVVVSVDYRLTPEHPYPAAFNDCYGTLAWVAANPTIFDIDPDRLATVGDSAGGNLSAALALAARDRQGPRLRAQALVYPTTGTTQDLPSYVENADGPGLTTAATMKYRDNYLPGNHLTTDPYARPAMATDYSGLPPALVHTAQYDPIRDDGRDYAAKLALAGTDVTYREARGMIHGFLRARFTGTEARKEFDALCGFLREHLGS